MKRRLARQFSRHQQAISHHRKPFNGANRGETAAVARRPQESRKPVPEAYGNASDKGADVTADWGNQRRVLKKKGVLRRRIGPETAFLTPEAGGVLTPHPPILTFSSSIPQRRPRPEMAAGGCRGRSLQKMFIWRDRIVSTGFPGHNVPWKRPNWGAEGVVESSFAGFGRFVWFFFRFGLAGVCRAGLRPADGLGRIGIGRAQ